MTPRPMLEKIIVAIVSAMVGGVLTYSAKMLSLEGRIDAMERSLIRIETRLFPQSQEAPR
ncbi:hypothetical protein [Hydrogenophaga laconesensis]|uniref:Uncharacterized protein n=1 Tax=Hydrogenophaga laconesensis TaxID=1805971 RepID=A0ABU1VDY5_9BURK|nr:hypothetical protein [Hydrogenophaga laconesensis]MDR7095528.1 hypothetical protein [Hydrogenophaga laconesensis]